MSLDAVAQTSVSIALVLGPIFVAYLLNDREKRAAFEREKKYDRKREAYEKALSAVRRIWDASLMQRILLRGVPNSPETDEQQALLENVDPAKRQEFLEAIDAIAKMIGTSLVISKFTEEELPKELLEGEGVDLPGLKAVMQRVTSRASSILLRVTHRAEDELTAALSTLTLADAPAEILKDLRRLQNPRKAEAETAGDPTTWLETRMTNLEAVMKADLQATIGK